ncbi:MAG: L-histidine N(alpha)-methyltransferase [Pseudomonadota bacterium]
MPDADTAQPAALAYLRQLPSPAADFRADVVAGLSATPQSIPPKYFYDAAGAELFEEICLTPEYYVTRAEAALLEDIAADVAELAGPKASLIEPGSGAAEKARILLDGMDRPHEYVLFDISREQLERAGGEIALRYPDLQVGAVAGDFTAATPSPDQVFSGDGRRICFFPGGTIGNFAPDAQRALLSRFRTLLRPGDALLLGVDAIKDAARLDAAYNDVAGKTAAFNLNLLTRMARELDAEVEPGAFAHLAFYNPSAARIEMHLLARRATRIAIGEHRFNIAAGETIHTENSWKFDEARLGALAADAGFSLDHCWRADGDAFMVAWMRV